MGLTTSGIMKRPLKREASKPDDEVIAQRMLNLSSKDNTLKKYIEDNRWERKTVTIWDKVDGSSLEDFPRLTLADLHRLTIGVYQLKQAASYTREHLASRIADNDDDEDNYYTMYVHKEEDTSSHQYQLWIRYTKEGFDPIQEWHCKCKNGSLVVGCCVHISSVLWYLGNYRHLPTKPKFHSDQYADFQVDAANWSESEASENKEQEPQLGNFTIESDEEEMLETDQYSIDDDDNELRATGPEGHPPDHHPKAGLLDTNLS
ncbi:unnamed protein product [Psylliodes chrysocephalus]|uniref:SWIM-type domain-containing protein n=1 Tax=Psylliodes chrysocephalus TaxID=3402493 RepID=A0A9P0DD12_9CUCU|nr:unnamed protein product [Psylliodes chrysocephala]